MIVITPEVVISGLKALVDESGEDYVYTPVEGEYGTRCVYVNGESASCGVGRFLANLGVPLERLREADGENCGGGLPANDLLEELSGEGVISIDEKSISALWRFQGENDLYQPWGYAVEYALRIF